MNFSRFFRRRQQDKPPEPEPPCPYKPPPHDPFFDNESIVKLDARNFYDFLERTDLTMVLFYHENNNPSRRLAGILSQAACDTAGANHSFAGVNCSENERLCNRHRVCKIPTVRIYTKDDILLSNVKDVSYLTPCTVKQMLEYAAYYA